MVDLRGITVNELTGTSPGTHTGSRTDARMLHMNEQTTLLTRIGKWFRKDQASNGDTDLARSDRETHQLIEPRPTFLRPWAKRDAAITHLQEGFNTLTDLRGAIRDTLDKQNRRQD